MEVVSSSAIMLFLDITVIVKMAMYWQMMDTHAMVTLHYHIIPCLVWLIPPISDIDECLSNPCDTNATCVNTNGSFVCTCDNHFSGDGINCTRVCENGYQLNESVMVCGKQNFPC